MMRARIAAIFRRLADWLDPTPKLDLRYLQQRILKAVAAIDPNHGADLVRAVGTALGMQPSANPATALSPQHVIGSRRESDRSGRDRYWLQTIYQLALRLTPDEHTHNNTKPRSDHERSIT